MRGLTKKLPPLSKPLGILQRQRLRPRCIGVQRSGGKSVWYVRNTVIPSQSVRSKPTQRLAFFPPTTKSSSTYTSQSLSRVPHGSPPEERTRTAISATLSSPGAVPRLHTISPLE